jgi:hypothetical protein
VVQVHYDEGVATHIGPEPCVSAREGAGEASAGDSIGQPPLGIENHRPGEFGDLAGAQASLGGEKKSRSIALGIAVRCYAAQGDAQLLLCQKFGLLACQ